MVLFFCLTTLQNWQNCPAALTNHSGFLSIQLGFFRTSRGGANSWHQIEESDSFEEAVADCTRNVVDKLLRKELKLLKRLQEGAYTEEQTSM